MVKEDYKSIENALNGTPRIVRNESTGDVERIYESSKERAGRLKREQKEFERYSNK